MKTTRIFHLKVFIILVVIFLIYLNRCIYIMGTFSDVTAQKQTFTDKTIILFYCIKYLQLRNKYNKSNAAVIKNRMLSKVKFQDVFNTVLRNRNTINIRDIKGRMSYVTRFIRHVRNMMQLNLQLLYGKMTF